jgi:hypothetical protein
MVETQFKSLGQKFGISEHDVCVIMDCVSAFPNNDENAQIHFIERVFLTNIKIGHYFLLAYFIGFLKGTEKSFELFYNTLKPCQRQN